MARTLPPAHMLDLVTLLSRREVKARYRQSLLGAAWALLQPVGMMLIFSFVFGFVLELRAPLGLPYPLFVFTGLLPWQLFASIVSRGSASVVAAGPLVTKVALPLAVFPLSTVLVALLDLAVGVACWLVLFAGYAAAGRVAFSWTMPLALPYVALLGLLALGLAFVGAAVLVFLRDLQAALPLLLQLLMFASPVVYASVAVSEGPLRAVYAFNPVAVAVDGTRAAVFGGEFPAPLPTLVAVAAVALLLAGGYRFFKRLEMHFADVI